MGVHSEELYYDLSCFVSSLCPSHERLMTKPAMLTLLREQEPVKTVGKEDKRSFSILCHMERIKEFIVYF